MRNIQYILLMFSFSAYCGENERFLAKITKATVFQNQAQITSSVKGSVFAGNNTITIENVSPQLDPQSIQIAGKGEIVIINTKYNNNFIGSSKVSPKFSQLSDSLRIINEELKMITYSQDALEREKELLKTNYSTAATTIGNTADKVKAMADFFRLRMADINLQLIKNERNSISLKERLVKIQNQINEMNVKKNQPFGEIELTLSAKSKTNFELEITYIVNGAGWVPIYDVRVKDLKSTISMTYKANVWQQSGLDWNDVKLSLSTSNPSQSGVKPELNPQFVDIYMPQPQYSRSKAMDSRAAGVEVAAAPMMDAVTIADYTTITENTLAVTFDIALPYTVANGGALQLVEIQQYDLPGSFKHFGLPKIDQDAFLTAEVVGWEQYNFLPGKINVYFEGAFVGESYLANSAIKDTLNLSMGRDKKVNLKREIIKEFKSKKAIGANIRESQAYRITIRNSKKEAVNIVLEDQIPVSKNSEIEVLDAEYTGAELNPETGKLTWKLTLKPSETKLLEVKYAVKYPKNKTIIGL